MKWRPQWQWDGNGDGNGNGIELELEELEFVDNEIKENLDQDQKEIEIESSIMVTQSQMWINRKVITHCIKNMQPRVMNSKMNQIKIRI